MGYISSFDMLIEELRKMWRISHSQKQLEIKDQTYSEGI